MTAAAAALAQPDKRDAGVRWYYGLGVFAMLSGHSYDQLVAWRHSERVWVPSPDIEVGRWPGWSLACIRAWSPDGEPFVRPPAVRFLAAAEVARHWRMRRQALWARIRDGSIAGPVVWIDDRPGWRSTP
ncbi:hypothetical protein [Nocardia sp. CNY236]|uniref:hypothetical protein n=1 Tax=Nocardia sp. CNY236 TaxID=1169152 RepID=UPI0004250332|nr:hypothetical protein [Nocardia sp. CNY236]